MRNLLSAYFSRRTLVSLYNFFIWVFRNLLKTFPLSLIMPQFDADAAVTGAGASASAAPPSVPISFPIKTLKDLESRSYFDSFHFPFNRSSVPLRRNSVDLPDRPRILVCHDMKGGYVNDKWVQGCENDGGFAIWHWYLMDIFVYFSHSLVTLPPPCWVNTAHRHGVKVLGTFITEWDEGKAICKELLETEESAQMYAERLSELAAVLGYDGWLINIENEIEIGQIPNLKVFLGHLTKVMHLSVPGALVIWYDSVTVHGHLEWQDQLNEKNKPFFDICDGIFMNYTWKEDYPKLSAEVSGDRKYDVYMGIDVFGRNTFGGGQWTTNVALDVLKKSDVSAAIFAPGWVYETGQPPDFLTAQNKWWSLVEKSWGIVQTYPEALPFYSDFNRGFGRHVSLGGSQLSDSPWYNLSCQSLQPLLEFNEESNPDTIQVIVDAQEASFNGGGNISFRGRLEEDAVFTARLFKPQLQLSDSPIFVTFSVKTEENSELGIQLHFSSPSQESKSLLLAPRRGTDESIPGFSDTCIPFPVLSSKTPSGWTIYHTSLVMNGHTLTEISTFCSRHCKPSTETQRQEYFALLGYISIEDSCPDPEKNGSFPPASSWIIEARDVELVPGESESGSRNFRGKLEWRLKCPDEFLFSRYNVYAEKGRKKKNKKGGLGSRKLLEGETGERTFLGTAHVDAFYISDLIIEPGVGEVRFRLQAWSFGDSSWQELDASPYLLVDLEGLYDLNKRVWGLYHPIYPEPPRAVHAPFRVRLRVTFSLHHIVTVTLSLKATVHRQLFPKSFSITMMLLKASPAISPLNSGVDEIRLPLSWKSWTLPVCSRKSPGNGLSVRAAKGTNQRALTGVVFEPFEEVKKEMDLVPTVPQVSLARQKFSDESEAAINDQINVEYNVSYIYHALYAYFDRDNVALKGLAKFFRESSVEERGHAEKFMEYQNKRGGRVKLLSILPPLAEFDHAEKGDALYAMELALSLEKLTNEKLLKLHRVAMKNNDVHLVDFVETEFLGEQVESIKRISEYVAQLRRVGKGHGVWHFDQMLLEEGEEAVA
ncbi:PREDICTED: cytosolic endo-beta-N-acetylglucosaminidase 1 [Tarenaya hassleriana]|uniref:cytosolic endo-beta-N-acetylglucosaminidase 1 n=1 Tax=Tarenaya hassleriana TaxID=28532 RepID=UPI00053C3203|nr:PREDICTED: cytosolic endo-beta-N-acetylglucosaminidase 1 [Tarenaya hassleriana]